METAAAAGDGHLWPFVSDLFLPCLPFLNIAVPQPWRQGLFRGGWDWEILSDFYRKATTGLLTVPWRLLSLSAMHQAHETSSHLPSGYFPYFR